MALGETATLLIRLLLKDEASSGVKNTTKELGSLGSALQKAGTSMTKTGTTLTKGLTLPILGAGVAAFKFASDVEEASSKANTVYGDAAEGIITASKNMDDAMDEATFLDTAGTFGALLTNMGFTEQAAADLSVEWLNLAQDMASFHNAEIPEALGAIQSALSGEFEPLKRFGVMLNETEVKTKAMEMGLWDGTGAIDAQTKALVINQELFRQQPKVLGDFERTSEGAANQTRILMANFKDTAATLGQELLPLGTDLLKMVGQWVKDFKNLSPETRKMVVQIGALAAAGGPLLIVLGKVTTGFGSMLKIGANLSGLILKLVGHWATSTAAITVDTAATDKNTASKNANAKAIGKIGTAAGVAGGVVGGIVIFDQLLGDMDTKVAAVNTELDKMSRAEIDAAANTKTLGIRHGDFIQVLADGMGPLFGWHTAVQDAQEMADRFNGEVYDSEAALKAADEAASGMADNFMSKLKPGWEAMEATVADAGTDSANALVDNFEGQIASRGRNVAAEAQALGKNVAADLAGAVRGSKDTVRAAMDDLMWAIKNPMAATREAARIEGLLMGDRLGNALQSKNPFIVQVAKQTQSSLISQWQDITGQAWTYGSRAGDQYANALANQEDDAARAAQGIVARIRAILSGPININTRVNINNKLRNIPMMADGGFLPRGGVGIVGESAPEWIEATSGGVRVTPMGRGSIRNVAPRQLAPVVNVLITARDIEGVSQHRRVLQGNRSFA